MKYLIVKTSSLGDIIQCFPVVSFLRHKAPYATISWLVAEPYLSLVQAHPDLDDAIPMRRKAGIPYSPGLCSKRYDVLFDLQGNCKSGLLTLCANAKVKVGFQWKALPEWPNGLATNLKFPLPVGATIREEYLALVQQYFRDQTAPPMEPFLFPLSDEERRAIEQIETGGTLVCPGAAWPSKRLTQEQWIPLLEGLEGPIQFVWGSLEERRLVEGLSRFGQPLPKLSWAQLQNVMARARRVIAMDSFPLHLAGTTATPTFAYFGPSSLHKFLPPGARGIQGSCPFGLSFAKRCPRLRSCAAPCLLRGAQEVSLSKSTCDSTR